MKYLLPALFAIATFGLKAQSTTKSICSLPSTQLNAPLSNPKDTIYDSEISQWITVMQLILNSKTNIRSGKCLFEECMTNAEASMDINGNRYIVYDSLWLRNLFGEQLINSSKAIVAHELGHHLSGHTLSLNYLKYEDAVNYCHWDSDFYDPSKCSSEREAEYNLFLKKSRSQELDADRFTGYLSNRLEIPMDDVIYMFSRISNNSDDRLSTHPKLDRRVEAARIAYDLSEKDAKAGVVSSLTEIKNYKGDFKIIQNSKSFRNEIFSELQQVIHFKASDEVINKSNLNLGSISGPTFESEILDKFITDNDIPAGEHTSNDSIFFHKMNFGIYQSNLPEIVYYPKVAVYMKSGSLQILDFENKFSPVIYASPLERDQIGFDNIQALMVEILDNGLRNIMVDYSSMRD